MSKQYLFALILSLFLCPICIYADGGGSQDLGGGNSIEDEAKAIMEYSVKYLVEGFADHLKSKGIQIEKFRKAGSAETLFLACTQLPKFSALTERDAIWQKINNNPNLQIPDECKSNFNLFKSQQPLATHLIIIKSTSWAKSMTDDQKRLLMLHEAFGITDHNDLNYSLSSSLLVLFQRTYISPSPVLNITHEVKLRIPWTPNPKSSYNVYPWEVNDEDSPSGSVDGIFQFVRFNLENRSIYWTKSEFDPRFETAHIVFNLGEKESDYFMQDEWIRSRKCAEYLNTYQKLNFFIVGELGRTIIDCGLR